MMNISLTIKSAVTLFAIVDPFAALPLFAALTASAGIGNKNALAKSAATTVFVTLTTAALAGGGILSFFGIGIPAFKIGGGILLLLMAISMLNADSLKFRSSPAEENSFAAGGTIVPLGIPLLAGPAAISHVIIQTQAATAWSVVSAMVAITVVSAGTLAVLLLGSKVLSMLGGAGVNVMTRVMGLILAAMSVEIIGDGLSSMFPRLFGQ